MTTSSAWLRMGTRSTDLELKETESEQQLRRRQPFRPSSKILGHEELFGEMKRASSTESERVWGHSWISKPPHDRIQPVGIKRYREEREEIDPIQVRREALRLSLEQVRGSQGIYRPDFGRSKTRFLEGLRSDVRFETPTKASGMENQRHINPSESKSTDLRYGNQSFLETDLSQMAKFPERQGHVSFSTTAEQPSTAFAHQPVPRATEVGAIFKHKMTEPAVLTASSRTEGIDRKAGKQSTTSVQTPAQKMTPVDSSGQGLKEGKLLDRSRSEVPGPGKRKNIDMSSQLEPSIFPDSGKYLKSRTTVITTESKTTVSMHYTASSQVQISRGARPS